MKILGIDDNEDLLQLSELALSSGGHEYTGVDRGREGVEKIREENFDLVLLDLSMPDFSGLDVIDALVKDGLMKKQKVVVFTASPPSNEEVKSLLEKGVHSLLSKPLDVDVLLDHVEKINAEWKYESRFYFFTSHPSQKIISNKISKVLFVGQWF